MPTVTKLTLKQKKEIIAKHAEGMNYSQLAREYGVSPNTIKNYVREDTDFAEKCEQVKKETEKILIMHI